MKYLLAFLLSATAACAQFNPDDWGIGDTDGGFKDASVTYDIKTGKVVAPSNFIEANNLITTTSGGLVAPLTPGEGLSGEVFNGSAAQTWRLDTRIGIGSGNSITGNNSLAVGTSNGGVGSNAMVAGIYNTIDYNVSAAIGSYLTTNRIGQVVIGTYNQSDSNQVFIVGQGSSSARKNIFTIDAIGNVISAGDYTNALNYTLKQTLQVDYASKEIKSSDDARKFKDHNTIGDYSGLYVFVDTYGGGAVPYTGQFRNYINAPSTNDFWFFDFQQSSSVANVNFQITDSASAQNAVLTPIVSGNVNANTLAVQNFRIQNTSYPITGTFSLNESGGSTATEYSGSLTPTDGRIAMDLLSGKITGNLSGTQTGSITFPATTNRALYLRGNPSGNMPNAVKYVSEYFTDVVAKLISPSGEVLWCMTTGNFNSTPLVTLYPTKVDRNAKVYYYTNTTIVNGSGKTVEAPKKAWDYVNGQLASNGTRYWTIGQYETLNGNLSAPYYKIRVTGIEIFPDLSNPDFLEAFSDPRNTLKVWRSHGVYGAEYVGIRNNSVDFQDTTAPIWRPAKIYYTKPAN